MKDNLAITRINYEDRRCKAALRAEQKLFAYYDLDYEVHFIKLSEPNLRVRVLEVGEGPPLMLVPGGSGDVALGAGLMSELKGWRIIAVNRPGGGMSDGIDHRQIDVRQLAVNTLDSVADAFDLEPFSIIGGSMGGLWAFWYALDRPERVSKLVQMGCPGFILDTGVPFFMRLVGIPGVNRLVAPNLQPKSAEVAIQGLRFQGSSKEDRDRMPQVFGDAAYRLFQLPTYLDSWITMMSAFTTPFGSRPRYQLGAGELKCIRQPVQYIWGENDPFGDLSVAHEVVRITPNAELHELPTGHLPFLDNPEATGRFIREFLTPRSNDEIATEPLNVKVVKRRPL